MKETNLAVTGDARTNLLRLETAMRALNEKFNQSEPECPLTHHFAPSVYGREIFMPKGTLMLGKIHKHAHLNVLIQGRVSVKTATGIVEYVAPKVMVSEAGTQRALYIHEDTIWLTVHLNLTNTQDLVAIEEEVIAKTFEDFDTFIALTDSPKQIESKEIL